MPLFKDKRTPEQIEAAAQAASDKACAAGPRQPKTRKVSSGGLGGFTLDGEQIVHHRQRYPVTGAHAEVNDFRSGLAGRRHTCEVTVTLASGEQLIWSSAPAPGMSARLARRQALAFTAAVNTAGRRPVDGSRERPDVPRFGADDTS